MTTVSEFVCSAGQPWSFSVPPAPSPLPNGNYTLIWTGSNGPTGQCLALDANNNVNVTSVNCSNAIWYFTSETTQGNTYYYLNYVPNGYETAHGVAYTIIPNGSSINCQSETQLIYTNDNSSVTSLPIQLSQDNTIFNNDCSYYYMPTSDGKQIIATTDHDSSSQWKIAAVPCPVPTLVASGMYSISFTDASHNTQYLTAVMNDVTYGNVIKFTPKFNLATCAWNYDASKKTLSTACGGSTMYLYFDPQNLSFAKLTSNLEQACTSVMMGNNIVITSSYQALIPSVSMGIIENYSCLSSLAAMSVLELQSPAPTLLMANGNYNIRYGNQCLNVDGNNVVLETCPAHPAIWTYDNKNNTLSFRGQCLLNPNIACGSLQALTLGDCSNTAQSQRFVLGKNGQMYDPLLKFCYSPTGTTLLSGTANNNDVNFTKSNRESAWNVKLIYTALFVFVFLIISGVIVLRPFGQKRRYGNQ